MRRLLILAALASLGACGGGSDRDSERDRDSSRAEGNEDESRSGDERDSRDSRDNESDRDAGRDGDRRDADPDLADELRQEVRTFRDSLPAREGLLTITDVDLDGTEIIYTGNVDADFSGARIAEFRRAVSRDLCTGQTGEVIRRGGSYTYNLRDEDGDDFETTVDSCD